MAVAEMTRSRYGSDFPLDNLTYDLVTILYQKSKGLEAYQQYLQDAQGDQEAENLLHEIEKQDRDCIKKLEKQLAGRLGR